MRLYVILAGTVAAVCLAFPPLSHLLGVVVGLLRNEASPDERNPFPVRRPPFVRRNIEVPAKLGNVTLSQYTAARALVDEAVERQEAINRARLFSPSRNHYSLRSEGRTAPVRRPRVKVTSELASAVQLVNAVDALNAKPSNESHSPAKFSIKATAAGPFWMENIKRMGSWPWGNNPNHVVFRNVKTYGAVGDGVTDDTDAINKAITDTQSCYGECYGSTVMGAIIYFPQGTYLVSGAIEISYGMQVIGDANNPPTLKSARIFWDDWVLSTDKYWADGKVGEDGRDHEYYINTANFNRQIRNFIIDISETVRPRAMSALHYQVAQATSLYNVEFRCSTSATTEQIAIYAENGSGGHMSDLIFIGGRIGIWGGNQQFTAQRLTFSNVRTAVEMIWDWGWMWKSIRIENAKVGFNLTNGQGDGHVGSITVIDSAFKNVEVAILVANTNDTKSGRTSLSLDNVVFEGVGAWLREQDRKGSKDSKVDGSRKAVDSLTIGRAYSDTTLDKENFRESKTVRVKSLLGPTNPLNLPQNPYAERPKPQYEAFGASDFVHTKDSCKGDGVTDDTACLQRVLNDNVNKNIVFVDAGTYMLSDTLLIPPGSRIVGENWAQLAAYGPKFQDIKKPRTLVEVGRDGDKGVFELQDLIFTSKGHTPGVVFVEWNGRGSDGEPGSAGMWDCHVRVGGALGTELTSKECPPLRSGVNPNCQSGSLMMHLTRRASAYLENVWLWVADHDLDDADRKDSFNLMTQTSVYTARGFLIESRNPTWLYGTSSEHAVFYQYQFFRAANVVAGMIQTEQPYYQPTPPPPEPFKNAVGDFNGDPRFPCNDTEPCDEGWALRVVESNDITILGAGLYSWFQTYTQECVPKYSCQKVMTEFKNNHGGIHIHNLVTIGATSMINADGKLIGAKENLAVNSHPFWSDIVSYSPGGTPLKTLDPDEQADAVLEGLVDTLNSQLHEDCYRFKEVVFLDEPAARCAEGYSIMGFDRDGRGNPGEGLVGRPICCKTSTRPKRCTWRGSGTDCNGQCHSGEVKLFASKSGGAPTESNDSDCWRGDKAFCCSYDQFHILIGDCRWTGCAENCEVGEADLAMGNLDDAGCTIFRHDQHFCCKHDRRPMLDCHWVGQGDCADNTCNNREVTLARSQTGDSIVPCNWGRSKSLCCTPNLDLEEFICSADLCVEDPELCQDDEFYFDGDVDPDDANCEKPPPWEPSPGDDGRDELAYVHDLISRQGGSGGGKPPPGTSGRRSASASDFNGNILWFYARRYPGPSRIYNTRNGQNTSPYAYRARRNAVCSTTEVEQVPRTLLPNLDGFQIDHPIEIQYVRDFMRAILTGALPSGAQMITPTIDYNDIRPYWEYHTSNLPPGGPAVTPGSKCAFRNINDIQGEILGSTTWRKSFRPLQDVLNGQKGRLMFINEDGSRKRPVADIAIQRAISNSIITGTDEEVWLEPMRHTIVIWRYMREPEVLADIQNSRRRFRQQFRWISIQVLVLRNLLGIFDEFDADYWETAAAWSRAWLRDVMQYANNAYRAAIANGLNPVNAPRVFNELRMLARDIRHIVALPPP